LQGQSRNALVAKLRGFREGSRAGTVMPQLAKGYSDAELEEIARYFAEGEAPR
jgi:cytochrome c553